MLRDRNQRAKSRAPRQRGPLCPKFCLENKGLARSIRATPYPVRRFSLASDDSHIAGLALRYANAVFELAAEERGIDRLAADFQTLKPLRRQSPELNRRVRSPLFSREDQSRGMQAVLAKAGA